MLSKTRNEKTAKDVLQKMYLLSEPAFKRIKEEKDAEKYLNVLDKELRATLYSKTLPSYKKWLKYKNLLIKYANFKKFLADSKANEDHESVKKFTKLEQRMKQLELQESKKNSSLPRAKYLESSPIVLNVNNSNPSEKNDSTNSIEETTFEDQTVEQPNFSQSNVGSELSNISHHSPTGRSSILYAESDDDLVEYEPIEFNFLNESDENQKKIDDHLISQKTIREQLDDLPPNIRHAFLTKDGEYPEAKFQISNFVTDEYGKNSIISEQINPLDAKIIDNLVKVKTRKFGWIDFPQVMKDDYFRLRRYLVEFQTDIQNKLLLSKRDSEKTENFSNPRQISTRRYTIIDFDDSSKIVQIGSVKFRVSNELLDGVIEGIVEGKYTPGQMKIIVSQAEKLLKEEKSKQKSSSFNDPMQRSSLIPASQLLSSRKKTVNKEDSSIRPRSIPSHHSTPSSSRQSQIDNQLKRGKKLFQSTLEDSFKHVKKTPNVQQGKGSCRKWEKI